MTAATSATRTTRSWSTHLPRSAYRRQQSLFRRQVGWAISWKARSPAARASGAPMLLLGQGLAPRRHQPGVRANSGAPSMRSRSRLWAPAKRQARKSTSARRRPATSARRTDSSRGRQRWARGPGGGRAQPARAAARPAWHAQCTTGALLAPGEGGELAGGLEPPTCCLQDSGQPSAGCWRVLSLQVRSEGRPDSTLQSGRVTPGGMTIGMTGGCWSVGSSPPGPGQPERVRGTRHPVPIAARPADQRPDGPGYTPGDYSMARRSRSSRVSQARNLRRAGSA